MTLSSLSQDCRTQILLNLTLNTAFSKKPIILLWCFQTTLDNRVVRYHIHVHRLSKTPTEQLKINVCLVCEGI